MNKNSKDKTREYRFKIEAYSPETMPLIVLTDYLRDVAELLGEQKSTHLIRIERGSTCPVFLIDPEAQPKIHRRIKEIGTGDAPQSAMEAFKRLNSRLGDDGGTGALVSPTGDNLISFPGSESEALSYGPFSQPGVIDGVPVMVGGTQEQVSVHLEGRAREKFNCYTSRSIAKEIAHYLFTTVIRAEGTGRWIRHPEGQWEMKWFKISNIEALAEASDVSLKKSIEAIRAIPAEWKNSDDPSGDLRNIRNESEA